VFAVKVINLNQENIKLRMIAKEIKIMEGLHHPNIVEYYGCYLNDDTLYIVLEYCEAGSVNKIYTNSKEPLKEKQIVL